MPARLIKMIVIGVEANGCNLAASGPTALRPVAVIKGTGWPTQKRILDHQATDVPRAPKILQSLCKIVKFIFLICN